MLIGDSHARQWIPALEELATRYGYTAYFLVREGCPGSDVTPWLNNDSGPAVQCEEFQDWAVSQVEELQADVVVLGSQANPNGFASESGEHVTDEDTLVEMYGAGMTSQVSRLAPLTDRVILIGDPPDLTFGPGPCLSGPGRHAGVVPVRGDATSVRFAESLRDGALAAGAEFVTTVAVVLRRGRVPDGDRRLHRAPRQGARERQLRGVPDRRARETAEARGLTRSAHRVDESVLVGEHDGLDPVAQAELGEEPGHVGLDRVDAHEELAGDLGVRQAPGDQDQHLGLALGEQLVARPACLLGRPA